MSGVLDKLAAIMRRDLTVTIRYRRAFGVQLLGLLVEMLTFYYLAKAVGPGFRPQEMDYFPFLLVGSAFYGVLLGGAFAFINDVNQSQLTGTMEVLVTTATPAPLTMLLSAVSVFAGKAAHMLIYLGGAWAIFRLPADSANLAGFAAVFGVSMTLALALGMLGAGLQVSTQKGTAAVWVAGTAGGLMTGTMFPVSVLPGGLQSIAQALPVTHSLTALRMALLQGAGFGELARPLLILSAWAVVLLPMSVAYLAHSVESARRRGTLSFY